MPHLEKDSLRRTSKFSYLHVSKEMTHTRDVWLHSSTIVILALLWGFIFLPIHVFAASTQAQHQNQPALSYNCVSNPATGSGHCYAQQSWGGANGADTRISLNQSLSGDNVMNYFITTEMWLTTSDSSYWIEVGVASEFAITNTASPFIFWADNRPGGGYSEHDGNILNSNDYSGGNVLARITRQDASDWNVLVKGASTSLTGTSTVNNISIGDIQIGTELFGKSGAYEPNIDYSNNRWWDGSTFHYQDNEGNGILAPAPLYANWVSGNDPFQNNTGGILYTCLTGSGC